MQKEILSKYKQRLMNINAKNSTLCRSRIVKRKAFDLFRLKNFNEDILDSILLSLIKDNDVELSMTGNVTNIKLSKVDKEYINNNLIKLLDREVIKSEISYEDIQKIKADENSELAKKAKKLLEKDFISDEIKKISVLSKDLETLNTEIDLKERETGLYELYTGFPIIVGKLADGTKVRAPLFLFPSKIYKKEGEWKYVNLNKEKIYINKVFLTAYRESYGKKLADIVEEYEEVDEFFNSTEKISSIEVFIEKCKQWGENNGIEIKTDYFNNEISTYESYKIENYKKYNPGELHLTNNIILGQYSISSNSLFKDMERIISEDEIAENIKNLLLFDTTEYDRDGESNYEKTDVKIKENESFFITELDYSQEKAVKMSEKDDNLVIFGPPGTGKSQVIANIVSDNLAKGKRVLVVSEKRTALDVIYKRLEKYGLSDKLAFVHDTKTDRKMIMEKVNLNYQNALNSTEIKEMKDTIDSISKTIDKDVDSLDLLKEELGKKQTKNVTLYELYTNSSLNNPVHEDINSQFSSYDIYDYKELNGLIDRLTSVVENIKYDSKNNIISGRHDFSEIKSLEEKKIISILENLNSELSNNNIEQLKEKFNSGLNKIDIEKIWISNHKNLEKIYINLEEIRKYIQEYKSTFLLSPKRKKLKEEINKYFDSKKMSDNEILVNKLLKSKDENTRLFNIAVDDSIPMNEKIEIFSNSNLMSQNEKEELKEIVLKIEDIDKKKEELYKYFQKHTVDMIIYENEVANISSLIKVLKGEFSSIRNFDIEKKTFKDEELNILNHFIENYDENYFKKLRNTYYLNWIDEIESDKNEILNLPNKYETLKTGISDRISDKKKKVPEYINMELNNRVSSTFEYNRLGQEIRYNKIISESKKQRKKKSLREFLSSFNDEILTLIPCWLVTPELASEILPYEKDLFDILIFDEASQILIERTIPSIYRAKKVVVAGDDKQLKPSSIGKKKVDEENDDEYEDEYEENIDDDGLALEVESLLDLAKQRYPSTLLSYHYRSKHSELINFSNHAFYGGNLIVSPSKYMEDGKPIEVIKVENGQWDGGVNKEEIKAVFELVKNILLTRKNNESIGIVTFNGKQQESIRDYFSEKAESDIEFREIYEKEKLRYDSGEDQSLFIKNIENVQGDERDIIIFSIAYSKDIKTGRVANRFGMLNQDGGENRLNVAISRAKIKMYIIQSIEAEQLNIESTKNIGPKLFKQYLQYSRSISNGDKEESTSILNYLNIEKKGIDNEDIFDSPFEEEVCEKLRNKNYEVHTQIGDSGYRIDLAIYDVTTSSYILGIECDGAMYHSSISARERDIFRQNFLESRGWIIHRIWSRKWWENQDKEIEKIEEKISNIMSNNKYSETPKILEDTQN